MSSQPCYGENLRFLQMGHGHSHPPLVSILIQPEGRMQLLLVISLLAMAVRISILSS